MDHGYIEENDLVDRYLSDRLTPDELTRFEAHFVDCPRCLDQLEAAEEFGTALRTAAAQDAHRNMFQSGLMAVLMGWSRQRQALAAAFALALVALPATWYLWSVRPLLQEFDQVRLQRLSEPQVNTPNVLLSLTRSADPSLAPPIRTIVIPAESDWLTISLEIEDDPDIQSYDAALLTAEDRTLWQQSGLKANIYDVVSIAFPSGFLPAGEYRLDLTGRDSQSSVVAVGNYHFRISGQ